MNPLRLLFLPLVSFIAVPAFADESGSFVVRLGQDTTSVETYKRTGSRLEVSQVGRAPRVLQRKFVYDLAKGSPTKFSMVVTAPGSTTPTQTINAAVAADSIRVQTKTGEAAAQSASVAFPSGAAVIASSSPWAVYEGEIMKFVKSKKDSVVSSALFVGSPSVNWVRLAKLGRDSVRISNERGDVYHARIDGTGRILGVTPVAGTFKVSVERVKSLDLPALVAGFAAREQAGAGLGTLSPRDSVVLGSVAGAAIWIDYSRPSRRGRTIFGSVVPYGQVWRTGANAATQFKTDKALDFGGVVVPAGFYSLFTIPSPSGWKLIVNGETGQPGTAHKPEKDLYTIDMSVTTLPTPVERFTIGVEPSAQGGTLFLDWDTTRASVPFTVKP